MLFYIKEVCIALNVKRLLIQIMNNKQQLKTTGV